MPILIQPPVIEPTRNRFYRPELDVLRLFAFFSVFLTHGPRLADSTTPWRHIAAVTYNSLATGGVYGLSLFFFLSSYLITELLCREQQQTGSVHLKWFYIRRVLRIWPLYYLAVACAIVAPFISPHIAALNHHQMLYFVLFVGYFAEAANNNPFGVLWSISVEELFYAVWPLLIKLGRSGLFLACILIVPAALLVALLALDLWYNPLVQFLFFASGALMAVQSRKIKWSVTNRNRILLGMFGFGLWTAARILIFRISPRLIATPIAFALADIGCVLIFLGFLNAQLRPCRLTRTLLYLGRISYGLYIFHLFCYQIVEQWTLPSGIFTGVLTVVKTQSAALLLTVAIASLSYRYFEGPFLKLKDRFAPIKTRL